MDTPERLGSKLIVVGIDVGMTRTGVAYAEYEPNSLPPWRDSIRVIQNWPGKPGVVENKVPTVVAFIDSTPPHKRWGFECDPTLLKTNPSSGVNFTRKDYFKPYLEDFIRNQVYDMNDPKDRPSKEDVHKWYLIFLSNLYAWVQDTLEVEYQGYDKYGKVNPTYAVQYIFSVPTTWDDIVSMDFETLIRSAGFGTLPGQTAEVGLTEAEAAAIYTMWNAHRVQTAQDSNSYSPNEARVLNGSTKKRKKRKAKAKIGVDEEPSAEGSHKFAQGDMIIVCDAGGGTTDVTALKIESISNDVFELKQECPVEGDWIGSVEIDRRVRTEISRRVRNVPDAPALTNDELDKSVLEFQAIKHAVGSPSVDLLPKFIIDLGKSGFSAPQAGIDKGKLSLPISELHKIFDRLIDSIKELIERQLPHINEVFTPEHQGKVYLTLSGGLGSSQYVQRKLSSAFQDMQTMTTPDPVLAVCYGLVLDQLIRLRNGKPTILRKCRASYGIVQEEVLKKAAARTPLGQGALVETSKLNDEKYVTNKINWFIDMHDTIDYNKPYESWKATRCMPYNYSGRVSWEETVVFYNGDKSGRPNYYPSGEKVQIARKIPISVEAKLHDISAGVFKKKYKHGRWAWWGPKFWQLKYELRIFIRPALLGVELWVNGRREGGETIDVTFDAVQAAAEAPMRSRPASFMSS